MVANVSCFEVVDETGSVYSRTDVRVFLEYVDGGKTLKVFVQDREAAPDSQEDYLRRAGETVRAALAAAGIRATRAA